MKEIPIFYACDNNFVKYTFVSIKSLIENSSKQYNYSIYILNSNVNDETKEQAKQFNCENFNIEFIDVEKELENISKGLPIRDYYSITTYYRFLIAELFPQYDKAIYIDSDTIVLGDVAQLFNYELTENLVGACHDQAVVQTEVFGNYVEKVLDVDRNSYFNAGILFVSADTFTSVNILSPD